jgi:hypothetical protein
MRIGPRRQTERTRVTHWHAELVALIFGGVWVVVKTWLLLKP